MTLCRSARQLAAAVLSWPDIVRLREGNLTHAVLEKSALKGQLGQHETCMTMPLQPGPEWQVGVECKEGTCCTCQKPFHSRMMSMEDEGSFETSRQGSLCRTHHGSLLEENQHLAPRKLSSQCHAGSFTLFASSGCQSALCMLHLY